MPPLRKPTNTDYISSVIVCEINDAIFNNNQNNKKCFSPPIYLLKGGTLTIAGIFLLVTFAPYVTRELTAKQIQSYLVSCPFLIYVVSAILIIHCMYFRVS